MSFRRGQLEYFVAVAEDGQMTGAARRLGVAQPALSQAIAQLEGELGVKLMERHPRGVTLTAAGQAFYEKARLAVAASEAAENTARSLARGLEGAIDFGFLGAPPSIAGRLEMDAFTAAYPDVAIRYRELPFPSRDTASWLGEVDVAACHRPPPHDAVWMRPLRYERRVALMSTGHPLAQHRMLKAAELLDETFVGFDDAVDPDWAGFWSLDDLRGGPPAHVTADRAGNPQEVLAALGRAALTLVPEAAAIVLGSVMEDVKMVPIQGAARGEVTLVGHVARRNPQVQCLLDFADEFAARAVAADAGRRAPAGGRPPVVPARADGGTR